ncbi:MAG: hypothetical protein JST59_02370 [Actinobacteria bacterium]|nr:hypothetical protein [Actinomycetota bacterium]
MITHLLISPAIMCEMVVKEIKEGNKTVLEDASRIVGITEKSSPEEKQKLSKLLEDPKLLCNRVFFTCYMGTKNSSKETRDRAENLAKQIGSNHLSLTIDEIITSFEKVFTQVSLLK